jgi:hypothetical protein
VSEQADLPVFREAAAAGSRELAAHSVVADRDPARNFRTNAEFSAGRGRS